LTLPQKKMPLWALLRPVDLATLSYLLLLSILILFFHHSVGGWGWYVLAHSGAALVILGLVWVADGQHGWLDFLRHWYPALIFFPLFDEMNELVNIIFPFWASHWLIRLDHALFGVHPTVWFERVATPTLTELMAIFYLAYFLLIPVAALPLYLREKRREFDGLIFNTALAYYLSFIAFLIFPAVSPRVTLGYLQGGPLEGGFLLGILKWLQGFGGIHGGAFPSSHVAVAFAILLSARRYERRVFWILLPFVLGLAVSTIYCRYHYAVDAIAGALLGCLCYILGQKLFLIWERARIPAARRIMAPQGMAPSLEPLAEAVSLMEEQRRSHAGRTRSQTSGVRREIE
jgi:membrane-associated phospholipid phosphatase